MNYTIAVIKGDGIGPEVVSQTMKVLDVVAEKYSRCELSRKYRKMGHHLGRSLFRAYFVAVGYVISC